MRAQEQEEYRNDPFAEMDESEDYGYEQPDLEQRVYRRVKTGRKPWYYLATYGIAAALALGTHTVLFHHTEEPVISVNKGIEYTNGEVVVTGEGSDILPEAFEIDGVTYEMPLRFEQLKEEGWQPEYHDDISANELQHIEENTEVGITWTKDDMSFYTYMTPQDGVEEAPIEECISYWGDIFGDEGDEILPYGITVGMSEEDLVEILDENVSEYTVDAFTEDDSDYMMENDNYSITICVIDQEVYNAYISDWNY